jgi:hypothetical protein
MKRNHNIWKIAAAVIVMLFVFSSAAQAIVNSNKINQPLTLSKKSVSAVYNDMSSEKKNIPSVFSLIKNFFENLRTRILQLLDKSNSKTENMNNNPPSSIQGGSSQIWGDDFLDESGIDIDKSYNYKVNKTQGKVFMKDTYAAWYNSAWKRMKPIDIYNRGSTTFSEYVVDMTVYYDSDMQTDFRDLRFTDEQGNDLYYWIGEKINGESANVLVRVPNVPPGHTTIYMFYGDSTATDQSNFDMIFNWDDRTNPDIMISYKNYLEGAWDPDVAYGSGRFLVAWEERMGPEDLPSDMQRTIPCVIHGRTYNSDGGDPQPSGDADIDISDPAATDCHKENPSIAYGNGVFFVAWEENPANFANRYAINIGGALVTPAGTVTSRFIICDSSGIQADPSVTYDSTSHRFFVVWEDARDSPNNYDVYGRIYNVNGQPVGQDFQIASGTNCQDEPWICSDDQGTFMVVYEDGYDPVVGPFGIFAQRFDSNGNKVGSTISIAAGSSTVDNIFPSVSYCLQTNRYFVAWNDGDISVNPNARSSFDGNIWGKILDQYGNSVTDNFVVQPGDQYIRTDVVPYLDTLFFVCYDGISDLWGKLISSDGKVQTNGHRLDDGSSQNVDWNNLAVGEGRIFAVWEDERDQASSYADTFGSVWHVYRSTGSSEVSYNFGDEKQIVTQAVVVTKQINAGALEKWEMFDALYSIPIGNIQFDILNGAGTQVLLENINPGRDISSITANPIRLRATFTRTIPRDTPSLDKWSVSWIGSDYDPPWTEYEIIPEQPDGDNSWYTVSVEFTLHPHDDVSLPEEIITYYKINDGSQQIYNFNNRPRISAEQSNNKIEFWSVDAAKNEEIPHKVVSGIKIDRTKPTAIIQTPQWGTVPKGDVKVSGTVYESVLGSGINQVEIWFQGGKIPENEITLSPSKDYFEWHFTAQSTKTYTMSPLGYQNNIGVLASQYEIEVRAYDNAGNMGNAYVTVRCSKSLSNQLDKDMSQSYPVNEPITFYGSTSGGTEAYNYYWTFYDGTTSTEQNPPHTYTSPRSYTRLY